MTALALDVGGTKLSAAQVGTDGRPTAPVIVPTPPTDVWAACERVLSDAAGSSSVSAVGIASAGPVDSVRGTVAPINIAEWVAGFPIVDAVSRLFPSARVVLALDGACAALAEHRFGAARGVDDLVGLVVSTGVGGGIVLGGTIVRGRTGNAGHIGHIVVPGSTDPCTCGGVGCLETVASGPNAVRWANSRGWTGTDGKALAESAAEGDPTAVAALQRAGVAIGQAVASIAASLDVGLAVIGGGFAAAGPVLWDAIHRSANTHAALSFLDGLAVVPAELGGSGTLTGAAALVTEPED